MEKLSYQMQNFVYEIRKEHTLKDKGFIKNLTPHFVKEEFQYYL